ncbi:50S ribosomal protein L13 [Candidatus Nardonella dryophthoridicola]|nr:50S ribosomal protein L13 [Candidatus Nardonella dryophthoridicola]
MKNIIIKLNMNLKNTWYIINASNKILGRISTKISIILQGKNKIDYYSNKKSNNFVIVINSDEVILSGKKKNKKIYYKHSGYIGNLKKIYFKELIKKDSRKIIINSVKGMLPKNKLYKNILNNNLKIFRKENNIYKINNLININ